MGSEPPDWALKNVKGMKEQVGAILDDPMLLVEGMAQGISDTYESEGIWYCAGYAVGTYAGTKGIAEAGKAVKGKVKVKGKVGESGTETIKFNEVKIFTAEETNQWFIDNVKPDYKPPYKPGTLVKEIELTENTTFVRVYDNMPDGSGMYGSWVMKADDIKGLTPLEIQNKFALPNTPKYVCDVELEVGTHIRVGEVNPLDGWGNGGGTQYDLIGQRIGDFKNERLLEGN